MLVAGQLVERYHVEAVIGQGGMAVVYRVRHIQLGSLHALKILSVPRPQIRERLLQEGRAQAGIRHPNVVSVTDVLEVDGAPALLMEYVDGPTLDDWLQRNRPTVDEADVLFRGICEGVGAAHAHGVVHRDLKPANVLLAHARNGLVPKVTDFGIAKVLASDEASTTRTNVAMGTPHYMAPEQIRDAKNVDARADVFSLGCLLYELICGRRPFDGPDVLELLNAVALGRYVPPDTLVPGLPDRVKLAIEGALRVDRDQRIQDCGSLLSVLAGTSVPPPQREGPEPMLVDPFSERPGASAPLFRAQRVPSTSPSPSWFDEETRARGASTTPLPPIDPNARTQPSVQRVEGPKRKAPTALAPMVGAGLLGIAFGLLALFGITLAGARVITSPGSDAAVLDAAKSPPTVDPELPAAPDPIRPEEPRGVASRPRPQATVADGSPWRAVDPKVTVPASAGSPLTRGFLFEAPSAIGRVVVTGDVRSVSLVGPDGPHAPGDVPPGRYRVEVAFGNAKQKSALEVEVRGGETVVVACTSKAAGCTLQR